MKNSELFESHAEDVTEDAYERMPIEDFGKSVLSKLGWKEGEPLGKNGNGIIKPILYTSRQKGLGLGARPIINPNDISLKKSMQGKRTHEQAFPGILSFNSFNFTAFKKWIHNAFSKSWIHQNFIEENKEKIMKEGSKVYIYKGQHKGLTGVVIKIFKPQEAGILGAIENEDKIELTIELDINKSEIKIK